MVRGSLVWVSLDPARGAEVPKTRPCIIVSRTEANDISSTVTVVPLSSVQGRPSVWSSLYWPPKKPIYPKILARFATRSEPSIKRESEEALEF